MEKEIHRRIVINPQVMVGKPVIKGTRIPVELIVKLVAQGVSIDEILKDYLDLTREDIKAALEYVANLIEGEDVFPSVD